MFDQPVGSEGLAVRTSRCDYGGKPGEVRQTSPRTGRGPLACEGWSRSQTSRLKNPRASLVTVLTTRQPIFYLRFRGRLRVGDVKGGGGPGDGLGCDNLQHICKPVYV